MALDIYNRNPIDFSNWEEEMTTDTTTLPPIVVKSKEDADYLNNLSKSWQSNVQSKQFSSYEPLVEEKPVGGTADYEIKTEQAGPADFFSPESWYGIKYLVAGGLGSGMFPTSIKEKPANLLEANYVYLNDYVNKNNSKLNTDYVELVFAGSDNVKPTLPDGTIVQDISSAMSDPKIASHLLKQAQELEKLPTIQLNPDLKWKLEYNHVKHALLENTAKYGHEIINNGMQYAAKSLVAEERAKSKSTPGFDYNSLLNSDGSIIDRKTYISKLTKESDERINKWKKEHTKQLEQPYYTSSYMNRTDAPNPMYGAYDPVTRKMIDPRPKLEQTNFQQAYDLMLKNESEQLKAKIKTYNQRVSKLVEKYDENTTVGINSVRTQFQSFNNPFNTPEGNRGERLQSIPGKIKYNLYQGASLENEEYVNLIKATVDDSVKDKIRYNVGNPLANIPKDKDEALNLFFKDIFEKSVDSENANKKLLTPKGSIRFQNIAGGDPNYYAYTFTFDNDFIKKFKGTKDDKGPLYDLPEKDLTKLQTQGITMYLPKEHATKINYIKTYTDGTTETYVNKIPANLIRSEFSEEPISLFAQQSKKAEEATLFETSLYLSKPLVIDIPGAGKRTITYDKKKNTVSINGVNRIFDVDTRKYKEKPLSEVSIDYAKAYDLDNLVRNIMFELGVTYKENTSIYNELLKMQQ